MFEKTLDLCQRLSGWILGQDVADRVGAVFNVIDGGLVGSRNAGGFDGIDFLDQSVGLVGEVAHNYIPFSEALVAALAVWELARVASSARVTVRPGNTFHANTVTCDLVALLLRDASWVTITCVALDLRVSPEQLSTLSAGSAAKPRFTRALAHNLIAGRAEGMVEVAVTGLTAFPAGHVPSVWCTLIAVQTHHVRKTLTLTAVQVTVAVTLRGARLLSSAHMITHTLSAALCQCIAVITELAAVASLALGVVQAFETSARSGITGLRVRHVDVVVALTGPAFSAHLVWVSVITRGAFFTPGTFISLVADAEHLVGVEALITRAGELSSAAGTVRTHAGAAVVSRAQDGVTIVAIQTPLAVVSRGVVPAGQTLSRERVALLSVAIASAGATVRESPVSRQTAVTLPPIRSGNTLALTGGLVAEGVDRPLRTAITWPAALWPKKEGRWGAFVAVPAYHVGPTLALATTRVTNRAERPLRVTLTGFNSLVQKSRHAEDVIPADISHGGSHHCLAVLQTAVTLEGFPGAVGHHVSTL